MLCVVFNHSVPPTTQQREHDTEDIQWGKM
jgi:hypothetical protein